MPLILNERRIDGQGVKSKTVAEKQALVPRKQNFLISTPDGAQLPDVWKDSVFQGKHLPATPCSSAWRALGSNGHATLGLHLAGTLQNSKGKAMPVSGRLNTFNALDPFFHHLPAFNAPQSQGTLPLPGAKSAPRLLLHSRTQQKSHPLLCYEAAERDDTYRYEIAEVSQKSFIIG